LNFGILRPEINGLEIFIFSAKFSQNFRRTNLIPDFFTKLFLSTFKKTPLEKHALDDLDMAFADKLPEFPGLRDYLELILPEIRHYSEDLNEEEFYLEQAWKEVSDEEGVFQSILHFFNKEGEYLKSVDGNVSRGTWRLMPGGTNKILIEIQEPGGFLKSELFDLRYLDESFFILQKNSEGFRASGAKFLMLGAEQTVQGLNWKEAAYLLYSDNKNGNSAYSYLVYLVIFIIIVILIFSLS
jgi:hypothetical protein